MLDKLNRELRQVPFTPPLSFSHSMHSMCSVRIDPEWSNMRVSLFVPPLWCHWCRGCLLRCVTSTDVVFRQCGVSSPGFHMLAWYSRVRHHDYVELLSLKRYALKYLLHVVSSPCVVSLLMCLLTHVEHEVSGEAPDPVAQRLGMAIPETGSRAGSSVGGGGYVPPPWPPLA